MHDAMPYIVILSGAIHVEYKVSSKEVTYEIPHSKGEV
jgi:hypothetical protein